VYLDEQSHAALGQPLNRPWDRRLHARLLERLTQAGAKAVVFDIVFSDPAEPCATNDNADRLLAQAMQAHGRVVLGADEVLVNYEQRQVRSVQLALPIEVLLDHAAGVAAVTLDPESDLVIRRHTPRTKFDSLPTLAWSAAEVAHAPITADAKAPLLPRWINYYGPPATIPSVSFAKALSPDETPEAVFRDKVVFVGARVFTKTAGERKDEYSHPWRLVRQERTFRFLPGVEVHATQFLNLLRGDWLSRLPQSTEVWWLVLCGAAAGFGLVQLRAVPASLTALALGLGAAAGGYLSFRLLRLWFPWLILEAVLAVAWLWAVLFNSIREYVQRRLFEQSLSRYLSPKLVRRFASRPELLKPGAEKQTLTILFSDIEGFTSLAEGMDPDDLAALMNRYFETGVSHCIHQTDGTVVKFIGDAIFAIWNAPVQQPDHALRAGEAALLLSRQVVAFSKNQTTWTLRTRIGLHTGVANVGNFGSHERFDYTAFGESINLASRMEGLNKFLGTHILLTEDTQRLLGERFRTRDLGRFQLKGFERAVRVFELVGRADERDAAPAAWQAFAEGLEHFQTRAFAPAERAFLRALELAPDDGPARFYLRQLAKIRTAELPATWAGEIELQEK
jgi:adenylate cyclase